MPKEELITNPRTETTSNSRNGSNATGTRTMVVTSMTPSHGVRVHLWSRPRHWRRLAGHLVSFAPACCVRDGSLLSYFLSRPYLLLHFTRYDTLSTPRTFCSGPGLTRQDACGRSAYRRCWRRRRRECRSTARAVDATGASHAPTPFTSTDCAFSRYRLRCAR